MYLGRNESLQVVNEYFFDRHGYFLDMAIHFDRSVLLNKESPIFQLNESILLRLHYTGYKALSDMSIRIVFASPDGTNVAMATTTEGIQIGIGSQTITLTVHHECLAPGRYTAKLVAYTADKYGKGPLHDVVESAFSFEIIDDLQENNHMGWNTRVWGYTRLPSIDVLE